MKKRCLCLFPAVLYSTVFGLILVGCNVVSERSPSSGKAELDPRLLGIWVLDDPEGRAVFHIVKTDDWPATLYFIDHNADSPVNQFASYKVTTIQIGTRNFVIFGPKSMTMSHGAKKKVYFTFRYEFYGEHKVGLSALKMESVKEAVCRGDITGKIVNGILNQVILTGSSFELKTWLGKAQKEMFSKPDFFRKIELWEKSTAIPSPSTTKSPPPK